MTHMHDDRFRVLALDGGGIRGAYTAAVLREFEHTTNGRVAEHFDLIVGTSTGGLIALGLGLGHSADEILEFYRTRGPEIFPSSMMGDVWRRGRQALWSCKYSPMGLRRAVGGLFGEDTLLGASATRLVVPAFDVSRGEVTCFKTRHHDSLVRDHLRPVLDVAMATSAAPTYFPAYRSSWGTLYVDGGVWANCPALVGVVEAMKYLGRKPDEIDVLSIGTTSSPFHLSDKRKRRQLLPPSGKRGFLTSGPGLIEILMQASASAIHQQAGIVLRPADAASSPMVRIDEVEAKGRFPMDDVRGLDDLIALGEGAGRRHFRSLEGRFFKRAVTPFVPIPANDRTNPSFSQAEGGVGDSERGVLVEPKSNAHAATHAAKHNAGDDGVERSTLRAARQH